MVAQGWSAGLGVRVLWLRPLPSTPEVRIRHAALPARLVPGTLQMKEVLTHLDHNNNNEQGDSPAR